MKKLGIAILVILMVVIVILVGVRVLLINPIAASRMDPVSWAEYQRMKTVALQVDDGEAKAAPFLETTQRASEALGKEWRLHQDKATSLSSEFSKLLQTNAARPGAAELQPLLASLDEIRPFLAAAKPLVDCPDYELAALPPPDPVGEIQPVGVRVPNFLMALSVAKLLRLRSLAENQAGDHARAFETAESILRAGKASRYSTLIAHLIAIALQQIAARTWFDAVDVCDDPGLLRETLAKQNDLFPKEPLLTNDIPLMALDHLGTLREISRAGIPTGPLNGKTGMSIMRQAAWAQAEYIEKIQIPTLPAGDARNMAQSQADSSRSMSALMGGQYRGAKGAVVVLAGAYLRPVLMANAAPNFTEAVNRANAAQCHLDLARCFTAAKISQLETGDTVTSTSALVPDFLPAEPVDPFSAGKSPYRYSAGVGFYSIGPDAIDQRAEIHYDPTNGTITAGDVFLQRN